MSFGGAVGMPATVRLTHKVILLIDVAEPSQLKQR
jgi:hypothetical protein